MKQQHVKVIRNHTENGQQMLFCEHWYYSQASYKVEILEKIENLHL